MFDLAWSEIAVIAAVAVIVVGPKDLPEAIRGVAKGIQKLRRMAGEFQGHLDEVVREAKLEDVRDQIRDIRNFDLKGEVERAVDKDGSIRSSFAEDPFRATPPPTADAAPAADAGIVPDFGTRDVTNPMTAPADATTPLSVPFGEVTATPPAGVAAPARMAPAEVALDPLTLQPVAAPPVATPSVARSPVAEPPVAEPPVIVSPVAPPSAAAPAEATPTPSSQPAAADASRAA